MPEGRRRTLQRDIANVRRSIVAFTRSGIVVVTGVWLASRVAAYAAGVGFDSRLLTIAQHLLDVDLLRHDTFTSLLYLHSQPPLFNIVAAAALRLPKGLMTPGLSLLWHVCGLMTALVTYRVMVRVGVRSWLATALVCLVVISPTAILFESWFFYSQLQMLLIALVLLGLARFVESRGARDGLLFTGSFAGLVLARTTYPVWFMAGVLVIVFLLLRPVARGVLVIALVPLVIALGWNVKNELIFDRFGSSSWMGMSLWRVASAGVPTKRIAELRAQRKISSLSALPPFGVPTLYTDLLRGQRYGVRATDALTKDNGRGNFNNSIYLRVSPRFQSDALTVLRDDGIHGITRAEVATYALWNEPGDGYLYVTPDFAAIRGYADWFDRLVLLRPSGGSYTNELRYSVSPPQPLKRSLLSEILVSVSFTGIALQALLLVAVVLVWRRRSRPGTRAMVFVTGAAVLLYVWTMVVSNLSEFGENNRFGAEVWPALVIPAAIAIELTIRRAYSRRRGVEGGADQSPALQA